ncbi:Tfp pilus assembly protein PilF [Singulisphaera sp. GP187]|uniref:tetratricopeptide repeat protein n=1 Tax=Singulisphaera sp. GP187 TaxID=1882752 RepID=UPI00092AA03C|nr:tetratricopeptide repeat protein [Singulisphaera sp. GP187]SIO61511.1 Tfp pilus assembly protein PilF [Singulisphaera sp. GP187]
MNGKLNLRFLLGLFVTSALVGGGIHWVHGVLEKQNVGALLKEADRAERKGDRAGFEKLLARYLAFRPEDGKALARYGLLLAEGAATGRVRLQALQVLERALLHNTERDAIRRRAAELAMSPELGKFKEAKVHLVTLLLKPSPGGEVGSESGSEPEPEDVQRLEALLLEFARQDGAQPPSPGLEQCLARPDAEVLSLLGRCLEEQARTGPRDESDHSSLKALACYRLALTRAPDRVDLYVRLAALLRGPIDDPAQADRVMDAGDIRDGVVAKNSDSYLAYLARAQYRKALGLSGVTDDVTRAWQLAPEEADVIVAVGEIARERRDYSEARQLLERGMERYPRDVRMYQNLAEIETRAGRTKEALAVLRRGVLALPDQRNLQWNLADLLINAGSPEAKLVIARLRRRADLFQPAVEYLTARVLLNEGQRAEAVRRLEKARTLMANVLDLKSLTLKAELLLAQCYQQLGNPDQQAAASRRALLLEPKSVSARLAQASALLSLGRSDEALEEFRKAAPESVEARVAVARLLLARNLRLPDDQRLWPEIDQALEEADRAGADAVEVTILRADALTARGQFDQARERLQQARSSQPNRVELWIALANLAGRQGKSTAILSVLDEAQTQLGDRVELRLARAYYWGQRGGQDALKALEPLAVNLDAFSADDRDRLDDGLADVFAQLGDVRRAEELWTGLAERRPHELHAAIRLFDLGLALEAREQADRGTLSRAVKRLHGIEGEDGVLWRFGEATLLVRQSPQANPKRLDQARLLLSEAAKRRPDWSQVPLLEAAIAEQEGSPERATEAYLRAIERGEGQPLVIRHVVNLLIDQKRFAEADRIIQKRLDQGPATGILGQLAAEKALRHANREEALALAARAVSPQSQDFRDHLWLGQIYWSIGERAKAEAALRRGLELADSVPETWIAWVEYLSRTDQKALAEAAIARAKSKLPPDQAPLTLALCYMAMGQPDRAEEQYQQTLAARPNDPATLRIIADFYLRSGQNSKADPYLKKIVDTRIGSPEALVIWARRKRAFGLALQGGYQQIREGLALIECNLQASNEVEDQRAKALLLAKVPGGLRDAIRTLEDLERRQPSTRDEKFVLAQLFEFGGDWPRAHSLMLGLLSSDDGNALYLTAFTRSLLRHGKAEEAQPWLDRLEKALPQHSQTIELKARWLAARGQGADAAALLKAYVNDKDKDAYLPLFAALLEELGQPEAAEAMYQDAVKRSPRPETVLILAEYFGRRGRLAEALDLCERAWSVCNPEAVGHASLLTISAAKATAEQFRSVAIRLEQAVRNNPDSISLLFDLANLYSFQGNYRDAEMLYRRIYERNTSDDGALNNLAWLLAAAEGQGAEALAVIGQAIALAGPKPNLLDTRAIAHLAMDRSDLAIKDLETAITANPSPEMYLHLAQARLRRNDQEGADAAFRNVKAAGLQIDKLHPLDREAYGRLFADLSRRETTSAPKRFGPPRVP